MEILGKTNKLQVLLVVNGLLVSALQVGGGGLESKNWPLFLAGGVFSLIWVMSIGRTSLFQKNWQTKARAIASKEQYKDDPRFRMLLHKPMPRSTLSYDYARN